MYYAKFTAQANPAGINSMAVVLPSDNFWRVLHDFAKTHKVIAGGYAGAIRATANNIDRPL